MNDPHEMRETIIKRYQMFYLWDNTELVYKSLQMGICFLPLIKLKPLSRLGRIRVVDASKPY